jgi:hypothetical protein
MSDAGEEEAGHRVLRKAYSLQEFTAAMQP